MKKIVFILFVAIVSMAAAIQVNAQDSHQGTVSLNIKLHPIQTLLVNPAQGTVDLVYNSKANYADGVTSNQADHLTIYSTGAFEISAKSEGTAFSSSLGDVIALNTVKLTSSVGTDGLAGATYSTQDLSSDDAVIVASNTGGANKKINIAYAGAGSDTYINNYRNAQNPTVYTTTVRYTIVAQ